MRGAGFQIAGGGRRIMSKAVLAGERTVLERTDARFPEELREIPYPPERLYVVGDPSALKGGLAVIGARKSTPYGCSCARRFARMAAEKGIPIISGGARGCDSEAHRAALDAQGTTVSFLGGGCDCLYPAEHRDLFQRIVNTGGAVVSEHPWGFKPLPYTFRARNRLIAGLARAVLIVEAGLPSGTFSTADEAIDADREVWAIPGAITSPTSRGSNRLIYQGAMPIVDDEVFEDALFRVFGALKWSQDADASSGCDEALAGGDDRAQAIVAAIRAQPQTADELYGLARGLYGDDFRSQLAVLLVEAEAQGFIARQADGRWGPRVALR